jgi:hypothetical protein
LRTTVPVIEGPGLEVEAVLHDHGCASRDGDVVATIDQLKAQVAGSVCRACIVSQSCGNTDLSGNGKGNVTVARTPSTRTMTAQVADYHPILTPARLRVIRMGTLAPNNLIGGATD